MHESDVTTTVYCACAQDSATAWAQKTVQGTPNTEHTPPKPLQQRLFWEYICSTRLQPIRVRGGGWVGRGRGGKGWEKSARCARAVRISPKQAMFLRSGSDSNKPCYEVVHKKTNCLIVEPHKAVLGSRPPCVPSVDVSYTTTLVYIASEDEGRPH